MFRFSEKSFYKSLSRLSAILPLCSLLLLSCATVPGGKRVPRWIDVLPPLSAESVYVSVDVNSSLDLLNTLVESSGAQIADLERVAENLDRVHAQILLSPGKRSRFFLVALGKLTPGKVAFRLNMDPSWQRVVLERFPDSGFTSSHWSYRTYWRREDLGIAAPRRTVLFAAGGDPAGAEILLRRLHNPGTNPLPQQISAEPESSDIFLYIPDPLALAAASVSSSMDTGAQDSGGIPAGQGAAAMLQKLPIRQVWITANHINSGTGSGAAVGQYRLEIAMLLADVENSRSVELLLRLLLTLWMRNNDVPDAVGKLKSMKISTENGVTRVESLILSTAEIAAFIQTMLPESNLGGG